MIEKQNTFRENLRIAKEKMGKVPLSDEEIMALACEEIFSSYSRDEKNYR
jgi:hypothetical protein